jgi:Lrp/AsnC family transcriptional regulator, leucine-responsive regulatory protein
MSKTARSYDPHPLQPTLSTVGLDQIDLTILRLLQEQGRTKRNELAEAVGLSLPSISDRMRKLEERGILEGVHGKLEPKRLGLDVAAFIFANVESSNNFADFLARADANPEILEVHAITGDGSHMMKVRTWNTSSLERLLSEIQRWPGVRSTRTNVVLSTHKETTALPIQALDPSATDVAE